MGWTLWYFCKNLMLRLWRLYDFAFPAEGAVATMILIKHTCNGAVGAVSDPFVGIHGILILSFDLAALSLTTGWNVESMQPARLDGCHQVYPSSALISRTGQYRQLPQSRRAVSRSTLLKAGTGRSAPWSRERAGSPGWYGKRCCIFHLGDRGDQYVREWSTIKRSCRIQPHHGDYSSTLQSFHLLRGDHVLLQ